MKEVKYMEGAVSDYADKRYEEDEELSLSQVLDAFDDAINSLLDTLRYGAGNLQRILCGLGLNSELKV